MPAQSRTAYTVVHPNREELRVVRSSNAARLVEDYAGATSNGQQHPYGHTRIQEGVLLLGTLASSRE